MTTLGPLSSVRKPGRDDVEDIFPLSPTQQGILFHRSYSAESRTYFVQARLRLRGAFDSAVLENAWRSVVSRHTALRTAFVWRGVRTPVQVVLKPQSVRFDLARVDLRSAGAQALEAWLAKDHQDGFDLTRAPLMRVSLLQLGEQDYVLVWSHEHLILDGWSLPIVLAEVAQTYSALLAGEDPRLSPSYAYREYVRWLTKQSAASAESYFRRSLSGFSQPTALPASGTGDSRHSGFQELWLRVPERTSKALYSAMQGAGITANTAVQAAWALTLATYSGTLDVVFGATGSGRGANLPNVERRVGLFISTLPVRVRFSETEGVLTCLRRLQAEGAELRQFEYASLAKVLEWSECTAQSERRATLFESLVVFENYPTGGVLEGDGRALQFELHHLSETSPTRLRAAERNNLPLTLVVDPQRELGLMLAYERSRFSESQLAGVLEVLERQLVGLASALQERPETPVGHLLGSDAEGQSPVRNDESGSVQNSCLHELFGVQVLQRPAQVAVSDASVQYTYAELNERAAQLGSWLRGQVPRRSVASQSPPRVALWIERSADAVALLLALSRIGWTAVPLEPDWPVERIQTVLNDCEPELVIVDNVDQLRESSAPWQVHALEGVLSASLGEAKALAYQRVSGAVPAYVLYTSGSTGRPKGVEVGQRAIVSYVGGVSQALKWRAGLRFGLLTSLAADLGYTSLWGSLCTGGELRVFSREVSLDAGALEHALAVAPVDVVKLTPTQLKLLLGEASGLPGRTVLPLHQLILGGEPLGEDLLRRASKAGGPGLQVVQHYGPTETSVGVVCSGALEGERAKAPLALGLALPGVSLQIASPWGRQMPQGATGEICVAGLCLAHGYIGRPADTAALFVPNPGGPPGSRRYRTGDLAKLRTDGAVEFEGRVDGQVKLHGVRIELEEVRRSLEAHSEVKGAAVRLHADADGTSSPRLCAYYVAAGSLEVTDKADRGADLLDWLSRRLPRAAVPTYIRRLDALPLTASGKLDLGGLPPPAPLGETCERSEPEPPCGAQSPAEAILIEICGEVLRATPRRDRSFLQLGGDSIQGLQVVSRARKRGLRFTPKQLFESATLALLAEEIAIAQQAGRVQAQVPALNRAPLSPVQKWFFDAEHPCPSHWNQAVLLAVPPQLTALQLRGALDRLVAHHPVLASRFVEGESRAEHCQILPPNGVIPLEELALDPDTLLEHCRQSQVRLNLWEGPLCRVSWFDGAGGVGRLLVVVHHLLIDAVSWRIVLEDLQSLLDGEELPVRTCSSLRWSQLVSDACERGQLQECLLPFEQDLGLGTRPLVLDSSKESPSPERSRLEVQATWASEAVCELHGLARGLSLSVDDVLLAALGLAVGRCFGAADGEADHIFIEVESHGRQGLPFETEAPIDLSRTVGWFTARYPVGVCTKRPASLMSSVLALAAQRGSRSKAAVAYGALQNVLSVGKPGPVDNESSPQISYNNLGSLDNWAGSWLSPAVEKLDCLRDPESLRAQPWECTVSLTGRSMKLAVAGCALRHGESHVQRFLEAWQAELERVIDSLSSHREGNLERLVFDPTICGLAPAEQEALAPSLEGVETVHSLTPLQQGLLFEGLRRPGAYEYSFQAELPGIEAGVLTASFAGLMARHSLLRSKICWEVDGRALSEPAALVYRVGLLSVPVEQVALNSRSVEDQAKEWKSIVAGELDRGLELREQLPWRVVLGVPTEGPVQLLWLRHHVVADGWSTALLLANLQDTYAALSSSSVSAAVPPASEEASFLGYLRWLRRQDQRSARDYFEGQLASVSAATPLPYAALARSGEPNRSCTAESALPACAKWVGAKSLLSKARSWAAARSLTLNTVVQGAWALLLSRHAGECQVCFGVTVSGRPAALPGIESAVGVFINTLPLVVTLPADRKACAWLSELQALNTELRERETTALHHLRAGGRRAAELLSTAVVFESYPVGTDVLEGPLRAQKVSRREGAHYGLTLVVRAGNGLEFELQYDTGRFNEKRAQLLVSQLSKLFEALLQDPVLGEVGLVESRAPEDVFPSLPAGRAPWHGVETLTRSLAATVRQGGERVALSDEGETLSYRELWQRSGRVAAALHARGVGPEVGVALRLPRSVEQWIAIVGVLRAGGFYVPLDASQPLSRSLPSLARLSVARLIAEAESLPSISGLEPLSVRELETQGARTLGEAEGEVEPLELCAGNLAYVIHTSGSTGEPKAVGVTHAQVQHLFLACELHSQMGPNEVWSSFHSYAFDVSVWELWGAWLRGGRLALVPDVARHDSRQFCSFLKREGVTVLSQTPTAFYALSEAALHPSGCEALREEWRLRYVVFAGEALDASRLRGWFDAWGGHGPRMINMYGITETTIHSTWHEVTSAEADTSGQKSSLVGVALGHGPIDVVGRWGHSLPLEVVGDMHVGGHALARGYLGKPGLTAERFVPDAERGGGARRYRSGDLARRLACGTLEFCGRADDQIKLRGYRIEPREIAHALCRLPEVSEARVLLQKNEGHDPHLVAHLVLATAGSSTEEALRRRLGETLPEYMLPARCVFHSAFPLTSNGKLDVRGLIERTPRLKAAGGESEGSLQGSTEMRLAEIWVEVLGVKEVGPGDDFFALGGHSLALTRVLTLVRDRLGRDIALEQLFEARVFRTLARLLEQLPAVGTAVKRAPFRGESNS